MFECFIIQQNPIFHTPQLRADQSRTAVKNKNPSSLSNRKVLDMNLSSRCPSQQVSIARTPI